MTILTESDFARVRQIRRTDPTQIRRAWAQRSRRAADGTGRLMLVAADHPARGSLSVAGESYAMADRYRLLSNLATALSVEGVDGVLGSPDILDDLLLLGLLEDKVVVGSANRGGLEDSVFEFDDRVTGHTPADAVRDGIDFLKVLLRVGLEDHGTALTLERTARTVTEAAGAELPVMIEPFLSRRLNGRIVHDLSAEGIVRAIAIAAALGSSSAYTWLKLPVIDEMEPVMESTTLPTLLLGGDRSKTLADLTRQWGSALRLPGVYGLVAGRSLLYPEDGDVRAAVTRAASLVHG